MSDTVNLLVRGQSNAYIFFDSGAAQLLADKISVETGLKVNLLGAIGDVSDGGNYTIFSATAFTEWDTGGQQASLLRYVEELPTEVKAAPTLQLWMHNEYDQQLGNLTADQWHSEFETDKTKVEEAFGRDVSTEFIPIRYPYGGNWAAVEGGMQQAVADGDALGFDMSAQAARMDGDDGQPNGSHLGYQDAYTLAETLAGTLTSAVKAMADDGASTPSPNPETPVEPPSEEPAPGGWIESFDDGPGRLTHSWGNFDWSVPGEVTLTGISGMMEYPGGKDAGEGYGTWTVNARIDAPDGSPGPAIVWWPGDNIWPGQEFDMAELNNNGDGGQFAALHWAGQDGGDAYELIDLGDNRGKFVDYTLKWEPGKISYYVDGEFKGAVTENVPVDFANGGIDDTIGFLSGTTGNVSGSSITVREISYTPLGSEAPTPTDPAPTDPGPQQPAPTQPDPGSYEPQTAEVGQGPDALVLKVAQDAYLGDAMYRISVDGLEQGTFTASALKSSGQTDTLTIKGDWSPGEHQVEVAFLNDEYDWATGADRNLFVTAALYNSSAVNGSEISLYEAKAGGFSFTEASPAPTDYAFA